MTYDDQSQVSRPTSALTLTFKWNPAVSFRVAVYHLFKCANMDSAFAFVCQRLCAYCVTVPSVWVSFSEGEDKHCMFREGEFRRKRESGGGREGGREGWVGVVRACSVCRAEGGVIRRPARPKLGRKASRCLSLACLSLIWPVAMER